MPSIQEFRNIYLCHLGARILGLKKEEEYYSRLLDDNAAIRSDWRAEREDASVQDIVDAYCEFVAANNPEPVWIYEVIMGDQVFMFPTEEKAIEGAIDLSLEYPVTLVKKTDDEPAHLLGRFENGALVSRLPPRRSERDKYGQSNSG